MPAGYDVVAAAIPREVCRPGTRPYVGLRRAIADLLRGSSGMGIPARSPEQVIARMNRCWYGGNGPERSAPGYTPATDAEGDKPIRSKSAWLAAALLTQDCPYPDCEDGVRLATGTPCAECRERRAQERQAQQAAAAAATLLEEGTAAAQQQRHHQQTLEDEGRQAAAADEDAVRQQLEADGVWGDLLEHRVARHMATWRDRTPAASSASAP